jgi:hypothetical protein
MDWMGNSRHGVVLPYNYWPGDPGDQRSPNWDLLLPSIAKILGSTRRRPNGFSTALYISFPASIQARIR